MKVKLKKDRHPGQSEARKLGYTLHHHSGDGNSATYTNKLGVCLTVEKDKDATLLAVYKLVIIKLGPFTFPHPQFRLLERMLMECLP